MSSARLAASEGGGLGRRRSRGPRRRFRRPACRPGSPHAGPTRACGTPSAGGRGAASSRSSLGAAHQAGGAACGPPVRMRLQRPGARALLLAGAPRACACLLRRLELRPRARARVPRQADARRRCQARARRVCTRRMRPGLGLRLPMRELRRLGPRDEEEKGVEVI